MQHKVFWFGLFLAVFMQMTCASVSLGSQRKTHPPEQSRGQVRQKSISLTVDGGEEIRLYEGSHALVIGVSDYTNGWQRLPGVKTDVSEVKTALEAQGFLVQVVLNPTRAQFTSSMEQFISDFGYTAGNRLLVYFAGHGHTGKSVDGRDLGYIIPADAPLPGREELKFRKTAISMDEIENYARRIEARHALFVFDSCFSGSLFTATRSAPPLISKLIAQPVRQFITAGTDQQTVPDKSLFRAQFVEGLKGAGDVNGDGYITGSELALFLQDKVGNYSREAQTPQYGKIRDAKLDRGDFVFALKTGAPSNRTKETFSTGASATTTVNLEAQYWDSIRDSTDPEDFQAYLRKYPSGEFVDLARNRIRKLTTPGSESAYKTESSPASSVHPSTSEATPDIAEVERNFKSGLYRDVLTQCSLLKEKLPNNGRLLYLNGMSFLMVGNYEEGLLALKRAALQRESIRIPVQRHKGNIFFESLETGVLTLHSDAIEYSGSSDSFKVSFSNLIKASADTGGIKKVYRVELKIKLLEKDGKPKQKDFNFYPMTAVLEQQGQNSRAVACYNCDGWTRAVIQLINIFPLSQ